MPTRVGRDRPLPARLPGQADRAQRGGDHLPRAHQQPHERDLRRLPHRARSSSASTTARWCPNAGRGRRASCSTTCTRAGGFTQINHPTIFPSTDPFFQQFCRGCPWDYTDAETDYSKVDAIEVSTGPPPPTNPFTLSAIAFYERALDLGDKIAAVGASDSHNAGRTAGFLSPAGPGRHRRPPWCTRTSCRRPASAAACKARHTYVKLTGDKGPDVRLTAAVPRKKGDTRHDRRHRARQRGGLHRAGAERHRRVEARPARADRSSRTGSPFHTETVTSNDHVLRFHATEHGRYRLQLERGTDDRGRLEPDLVRAAAAASRTRAAATATTRTRRGGRVQEVATGGSAA